MSTFKVEIVKINKVESHPNADRLDLVSINDWNCVSSKGSYQAGDLAIYFPIDSILPGDVESRIFGIDSKVKLTNSRVRTIKLRGAISQGLVVKPEVFADKLAKIVEGEDVTSVLGVTKYEPPTNLSPRSGVQAASKKQINPNFSKYGGIENAKNYPTVFEEGEEVIVTEKIHGSHFRAGYVPFHANTLWKKIQLALRIAPKYEFVYGSNNVQLQNKLLYNGYYDTNIYAEAVVKYDLKKKILPGMVVHGEIYGDGVQKNYSYGCKKGERKLVLFDIKMEGRYVSFDKARAVSEEWLKVPFVSELYRGPFDKGLILKLRDGDSVMEPTQKVREGVVVKPVEESVCFIGRKLLKFISDQYLLKNQDDETIAH